MEKPSSVYLPLSEKKTRFISIQPCQDPAAPIECKLTHGKLCNGRKYEALSYVWGTEDAIYQIFVNEKQFRVRPNLYHALKQLRRVDKARVIWVDAICIDQENIAERNRQVQRMRAVYQKADRVVCWLGCGSSASHRTFTYLKKIAQNGVSRKGAAEAMRVFQQLSDLEYWNRLWIVQEVILASRLQLFCGTDELSGDDITMVMKWIKPFQPAVILDETNIALRWKYKIEEQESPNLFELFDTFSSTQCSDKRDMIFGLHGLSNLCCRKKVLINYSKPIYEATEAMLRHHRTAHNNLHHIESKLIISIMNFYSNIRNKYGNSLFQICQDEISGSNATFSNLSWRNVIVYTSPPLVQNVFRDLTSFDFDIKSLGHIKISKSWAEGTIPPYYLDPHQASAFLQMLLSVVQTDQEEQRQGFILPIEKMKIFYDSNGMLGLVPECVETGDVFNHSADSNKVTIVRVTGSDSQAILETMKTTSFFPSRRLSLFLDGGVHSCHLDLVTSESLRKKYCNSLRNFDIT